MVKVNFPDTLENERKVWNLLQFGPRRTGKTQERHAESLWSWSACTGLCKGSTTVGKRRN